MHRFDDIASVDVGIVTGANNFFLVDDATVERFGLQKWARPMFGRSEHCPGVIYDRRQHRENAKLGSPTNFLWFGEGAERDPAVKKYVRLGEKRACTLGTNAEFGHPGSRCRRCTRLRLEC